MTGPNAIFDVNLCIWSPEKTPMYFFLFFFLDKKMIFLKIKKKNRKTEVDEKMRVFYIETNPNRHCNWMEISGYSKL